MIKNLLFYLVVTLCLSPTAKAYPDFIGFGYRNCIGCHFNGAGGGALTDYGRGVFASEIAANPFAKKKDEDLAAASHFLGKKELPWWLRLGVKYRGLRQDTAPFTKNNTTRYYNMQNHLNLNFLFDHDSTFAFISTLGHTQTQSKVLPNSTLSPSSYLYWQEYYFRLNFKEDYWVYLGFMDKVFGIRHPDHNSVNRSALDLGQNDQVHGLQFQWAKSDQDLFFQYWLGNAHRGESDRNSGFSLYLDRRWSENHSWGLGYLQEGRASNSKQLIGIHNKMGFGSGHAFLMEFGLKQAKTASTEKKSAYFFTQGDIRLKRGLFLISTGEYSKDNIETSSDEILYWKMGFLWFPAQRIEFRFTGISRKVLNSTQLENDQWTAWSQLHLSL